MKFKGMTSLLSGVSVKLCSLLRASLVYISNPFCYFKSIVYSLSLVVGVSVLLLTIYSIALWSTSTSKYQLWINCTNPCIFTNNLVSSNSVTPKFCYSRQSFGMITDNHPFISLLLKISASNTFTRTVAF